MKVSQVIFALSKSVSMGFFFTFNPRWRYATSLAHHAVRRSALHIREVRIKRASLLHLRLDDVLEWLVLLAFAVLTIIAALGFTNSSVSGSIGEHGELWNRRHTKPQSVERTARYIAPPIGASDTLFHRTVNAPDIHTPSIMHTRTARLTLREFTLEDIPSLYALESIPEVARYQTWPPRTQVDAERVVGEIIAEAAELPHLIVEQAVLVTAPRTNEGALHEVDGIDTFIRRVSGRIDSAARTAEALHALIELLQGASRDGDIPPFDQLIIECDPRNDRSSKLAERVVFTLESCTEKAFECKGEWVGSKVYSRGLDIEL
ncbi:hypothetical protein B0H19DRAFT_1386510 [Mycena capillaripes]|nr:hypothetical protein B0H19DRAFT_1386510 [Mycena capillaripes]